MTPKRSKAVIDYQRRITKTTKKGIFRGFRDSSLFLRFQPTLTEAQSPIRRVAIEEHAVCSSRRRQRKLHDCTTVLQRQRRPPQQQFGHWAFAVVGELSQSGQGVDLTI